MIRHKLLYRLIEIRISILGGFSLKDVAKKTVGFLKISKIRRVSLQDSENPRLRRPNLRETQLLPRRKPQYLAASKIIVNSECVTSRRKQSLPKG